MAGDEAEAVVVLPSDDLTGAIKARLNERRARSSSSPSTDEPIKIHVGPGIIQTTSSEILALKGGILHYQHPAKFSLRTCQKRYIPVPNDLVIGVVTAKLAEMWRVDIGGPQPATLSVLTGFESTTRKNKPNYAVGAVVYARLALAHPDLEPELACFDTSGNIPADVFGELGGKKPFVASTADKPQAKATHCQLIRTSCHFSRSLQSAPQPDSILSFLGRFFAFELVAGANGRVFVEAADLRDCLCIANLLKLADRHNWTTEQCEQEVHQAATKLGKSVHKKARQE